jgi:hypothetical protein
MIAGARDVGVSPAIVGAFPRKEAALVEVTLLTVVGLSCVSFSIGGDSQCSWQEKNILGC